MSIPQVLVIGVLLIVDGLGQTGGGSGVAGDTLGRPLMQSVGRPTTAPSGTTGRSSASSVYDPAFTPLDPIVQQKLERGRQSDRQRRMMADTDRLLSLAAQLKADVDQASREALAADALKKAEEIEKLARSVKDRMKG